MTEQSGEYGNCFSFVKATLEGRSESGPIRLSTEILETLNELGYEECSQEEAEVVLKVDEDGRPYHAAIVVELRSDGNHLLKHRFYAGGPVESVLLNAITPRDLLHHFVFYAKRSSDAHNMSGDET